MTYGMGITYETVLQTELGPLLDSAKKWKEMGRRFGALSGEYRDHVSRAATADSWQGQSADAFKGRGKVTQEEYEGARHEAWAVGSLLEEAHGTFDKYKKRLEGVRDEARAACMTISWNGECTLDLAALEQKDKEKAERYKKNPKEQLAAEQAHTDKITKVVNDVRAADRKFERALLADPSDGNTGVVDGFNSNLRGDAGRANADMALELASKRDKLNDKQLTQLNSLLKDNYKDNSFSESFTTRMGAKGTANFWAAMDPYNAQGHRAELLKETRNALSGTLATATRSDSPAMQQWGKKAIALGDERIGDDEDHSPYGYQVMSDLMHHGNYGDKFLQDYGNSLVKFEKEHGQGEFAAQNLWVGSQGQTGPGGMPTNDTLNNWGNDPMNGLMEAMGHSPEASNDFFSDKDTFDYLVGNGKEDAVRHWPDASLPGGGEGKGYDALGHGLESAVTGKPYDSVEQPMHRGPEQAEVMQRVMSAYGGERDLLGQQPGIGDSLGRMGSAYVAEINYSMDDYLNNADGKATDKLLGTDGKGMPPEDAYRFMHTLGRDPDAHHIMSNAQEVMTASRVHHLSGTGDEYLAAEIGAQGHGALDEGRAEEMGKDGQAKEEELKQSANWKKEGGGIVVYGATGALGGMAGPAAPIAVPLITGAAGSAATSEMNAAIDANVTSEATDQRQKTFHGIKDFDRWAELNATDTIRRHMEDDGLSYTEKTKVENSVDEAYRRGRFRSDGDNAR